MGANVYSNQTSQLPAVVAAGCVPFQRNVFLQRPVYLRPHRGISREISLSIDSRVYLFVLTRAISAPPCTRRSAPSGTAHARGALGWYRDARRRVIGTICALIALLWAPLYIPLRKLQLTTAVNAFNSTLTGLAAALRTIFIQHSNLHFLHNTLARESK